METLSEWNKNPIIVSLYDAIGGRVVRSVVFVGDVPRGVLAALRASNRTASQIAVLREFYPAAVLKEILAATIAADIFVYPEDNFLEFREKIYMAIGVPLYRQHLFAPGWTIYDLWTDAPRDINILRMNEGVTMVQGLPIDYTLHANSSQIRVEARDVFTLVGGVQHRRYSVVDLAQFTAPRRAWLLDTIADQYMFGLIYWGFIVKYWPMLTPEVYAAYLRDEDALSLSYPDMAMSIASLRRKYSLEHEIINEKYANAVRARASGSLGMAITQFTAMVPSVSVLLNIGNIFDRSVVSADVPEIRAFIDRSTMVARRYTNAPDIDFPSLSTFRTGIVYAIRTREAPTPRYLWLAVHPNGKYIMRSSYREEEGIGFDDIYEVLKRRVRPIINGIESLQRLAFVIGDRLERLRPESLIYQGLNVALFWRLVVSMPAFKMLRDSWDKPASAGIVFLKPVNTPDRIEMLFRKGMHEYDPSQIDRILASSGAASINNQYSHLSAPAAHIKWEQNYGGRATSIILRDNDVRIDVTDIREDEFAIFRDFIQVHLYTLRNAEFNKLLASREHGIDRRLRRLRERDPALYNLSRYGISRNYSKICQSTRQPTIYDKSEYSALSQREQGKLVKYWNYTREEPVWYGCPDPVHAHLGFIAGVHPNGWCIPCCNKRKKDADVIAACLAGQSRMPADSRHIMVYGKELPKDRVGNLHNSIQNMFGANSYLVGTETQTNVPDYNVVYAMAYALGVTTANLIDKMVQLFTDSFYDSVIDLCGGYSREIIIGKLRDQSQASTVDWIEIITRLLYQAYGFGAIILIDVSQSFNIKVPQIVIDARPAEYIACVVTPRGFVYPVMRSTVDMGIEQLLLPASHRSVALILDHIAGTVRPEFNLEKAEQIAAGKYQIVKKYVNLRNLCYAILLDGPLGKVYATIEYSPHHSDGTAVETDAMTIESLPYAAAEDWSRTIAPLGIEVVGMARPTGDRYKILMLSNNLHIYFTGDAAGADWPIMELEYDPLEINHAILTRAVPPRQKISESLYRGSIYNLLLMVISEEISKDRDAKMREIIIANSSNLDRLAGRISPTDLFILKATMQFSGLKGLKKRLDNTFEFDRIMLHKIQESSREEAVGIVREMLGRRVHRGRPDFSKDFPNIYTTCTIDPTQLFCEGQKLIIEDVDAYVDIIVDDLRKPLLAQALFTELWSHTAVDDMQFTQGNNDKIMVYKL